MDAVDTLLRACDWVFYNPRTLKPFYDARTPWEKARKAAGHQWLKVKDLRTLYAIRLAEAEGVELHHVQRALGHSSIVTTQDYYARHSDRSTERRVLRVLEGGKERK